jgi:ferredoxin
MQAEPSEGAGRGGPPNAFRIIVHPDKCIGAGHCVVSAPDLFGQDDDGVVILLDGHPPAQRYAAAMSAANMCPTSAIVVEAQWTGQEGQEPDGARHAHLNRASVGGDTISRSPCKTGDKS